MQMYRGMDIATAKPTDTERRGIAHHMMDILEINESFSVADYVQRAHAAIADIHSRGALPIIIGGTGLYVDSLVNNITFSPVGSSPELRDSLNKLALEKGNEALFELLKECDPEAAKEIHPNNIGRVIRAIEQYRLSGMTKAELNARSRAVPSPYDACIIGLTYSSRSLLYKRINQRVDEMVGAGLLEEAKAILESGKLSPTSAQAIGYKELRGYFEGTLELSEALDLIKAESRRYAKRQMTWFGRDKRINWFFTDQYKDNAALADAAQKLITASGIITNK